MALSQRHRHQLLDLGKTLLPDGNIVRAILTGANIERYNMNLDGTPIGIWDSVTTNLTPNTADQLLTEMIRKFPGNPQLKELQEDIARLSLGVLVNHIKTVIASGKCVLFLGPHVFKCVDGTRVSPFNDYLSRQLSRELTQQGIYYDDTQSENLSYIIDRYETRPKFIPGETEVLAHKKYRSGMIIRDLHELIGQQNFPLIINTNPDTILQDGFNDDKYIFRHYDMTNTVTEPIPADYRNKTIVYNIYGSFNNPYSILFTEKEAVQFAKKTYAGIPPIPEEIKEITAKSYGLFLGFDFKDWHLKILFDILDLKNKPGNYSVYEDYVNVVEYNKEYYERQYNMTFLRFDPNFETKDFLNQL